MIQNLLQKYNVPVPRYTSYPPANYFTDTFTNTDYEAAIEASNTASPGHISFYVHIPFCRHLCHYCGCNSFAMMNRSVVERYIEALHVEIDKVKERLAPGRKISQIHYGGGSPTAMPVYVLKELNDHLLAGFETIDFTDKYAAIKIHFGEYGNLAFLRPNYARVVADYVKELGGKPFLTDCNTLYVGSRKNALDHLETAYVNGFSPYQTGCHVIIGDGLKGTDETIVPIDGEYVKEAKIGHAIMDADVFISLSHFKGHEATGFGGALKNIGMGCGSRAGKMQQHASGKPAVNAEVCRGCHRCAKECGSDAITYVNKKAVIDYDKCKGCGRCIGACSFDAVYNPNSSANELLDRKMAEYAQAVCHGRPHFHIALVQDISPNCDCHGENDAPILPDIGMFASFDPVALDQACADACLQATPIANSQLGEHLAKPGWHFHHDHFKDSNPNIEWKATLDQAEKIGLGTREYELKRIK